MARSMVIPPLLKYEQRLTGVSVFCAHRIVVIKAQVRRDEVRRRSEKLPYIEHIDNAATGAVVAGLRLCSLHEMRIVHRPYTCTLISI
jgi:hypothetical protein